jgi:hypothetical protein
LELRRIHVVGWDAFFGDPFLDLYDDREYWGLSWWWERGQERTRSIIFLAFSDTNGRATGGIISEAVGLAAMIADNYFLRIPLLFTSDR